LRSVLVAIDASLPKGGGRCGRAGGTQVTRSRAG
jgi:hypothetical protein